MKQIVGRKAITRWRKRENPQRGNLRRATEHRKQRRKPEDEAKIAKKIKNRSEDKGKTQHMLPERSMWDPGRGEPGVVRRADDSNCGRVVVPEGVREGTQGYQLRLETAPVLLRRFLITGVEL